ncbi:MULTISPECIES: glycosyltransferase [Bradyrhizobium]|uniref:Glycosyltransferase involved in cell wall bisynthesis n=2 Tax=Bradyrhizobium TaxID=374 RepID=A0ABY0Q900_9BRAD|nr:MULTISPECIES: glycosyltransferase [Bradyrhizobium]SDJ71660.1 Glycosyltransferase involved in cell wall bisynthesis [Bradyrhizobium ottawaense]SEC21749.1 Glycosyltransferase involved in cell wall bisynthesis [Bradyrhizobium lablabi]
MTSRPKILFVAMHTSVHAARWVELTTRLGYDCHVFPINAEAPHQKLAAGVTLHQPVFRDAPAPTLRQSPQSEQFARALRVLRLVVTNPRDAVRRVRKRLNSRPRPVVTSPTPAVTDDQLKVVPFVVNDLLPGLAGSDERIRLGRANESDETALRLHGPEVLAALIEHLKPDLIHSMEFQHAGYLVLAARDRISGKMPAWMATNWGSDIYHFGKSPDHALQIRRVCEAIDLYSCECHRDLALGREFGYRGPDLPVLPNSGGIDMAQTMSLRHPAPPSARKLIMVKGYDHFAGRAMVSLAVLERFAAQLRNYTIVLFSVGARPRVRALELAAAGTLDIRVIDWATHDEILQQFGLARLYLGISASDAISTSVLEAMAMGAFPIQTDTSCCAEWFIPDTSGFAVPVDDFEVICDRFQRALTDDALVDAAATINLDIIKSRLAIEVFMPRMGDFYAQAFCHAHSANRRATP